MEDILSPTHAFLDFDFSEFIDKNFDVPNGIFSPNTKSPSVLSSCGNSFSDFLSQSTVDNYTHEYLDHPLWSSIEELAFETSKSDTQPPTFACIDDFIKDPQGDLVELVQQSDSERTLFQNLITHNTKGHASMTPDQILCDQQLQKEQQKVHQQELQHYMYKQSEKCQPQLLDQQHFQFHSNYLTHPQVNPPPMSNHQKRRKTSASSQTPKQSTKMSTYSSSNNSNYTHSDSVNAQLLRELIRQAGRNNRNISIMNSNASIEVNNSSMILPSVNADFKSVIPPKDSYHYAPTLNGNYHPQPYMQHLGYYTGASSIDFVRPPSLSPASSRHHVSLPYTIPNINNKKHGTVKHQKSTNHPYQRHISSKSSNMGKPSMYSSDISQAQLLEIQAISRAQQDFIRAREQQEAEKEMSIKHQKKVAGQSLL